MTPIFSITLAALALPALQQSLTYPVADTGQAFCYNDTEAIGFPREGGAFHGQDAQYTNHPPSYRRLEDGTVSDRVTGLMWTQDLGEKLSLDEALKGASRCRIGGHTDWRLPTIKELYSLILFSGTDPDPRARDSANLSPFIDASVFTGFQYGDPAKGERIIDAQYASATRYVSTTMHGNETMFGVNFADGRIKGYPAKSRGDRGRYRVMYVRGNPEYGQNKFVDNGDGTVTDAATGLTWMKADSGKGLDWSDALAYSEGLELAGHDDWRLPSAKELQSIVDYSRSPDTSNSAAMDPVFDLTTIKNEGGATDYGQYWSSTTHVGGRNAATAAYVAFGRALGFMSDRRTGESDLLDVHGAGAQRSDPKSGDAAQFPRGRGPQGDVIRIENMVRCVRGGNVESVESRVEAEAPASKPEERGGREAGRAPTQERQQRFIRRFDANKDGQVTRDEYGGEARRFDRFDQNGDGVVTSEERVEVEGSAPKEPASHSQSVTVLPRAASSDTPPNIILILTDDMGWTGLSTPLDERLEFSQSDFYQTPHIASLADEGMRFSNAYSPAALCTPSRASILTGKTPARLHITTPGGGRGRSDSTQKLIAPKHLTELPDAEVTIAEALAEAGYASAHLGKWHLGRSDPGEHGFDVHDGATANAVPGAAADSNPKDIFGVTERGMAFMQEQAGAGTPFYLQLSHYAVHSPVESLTASQRKFEEHSAGERHKDVEFAAMTFDLDASVGLLMAEVERLGLTDNTYVVLMSDNGASGSRRNSQNTPLRGGKGSFFEGGIRVPLIVRGPNISPESFSHENVTGFDLLPTFCEWSGVQLSASIDGTSLVPLCEGDAEAFKREDRALLFHFPHYGQGPKQRPQAALLLDNYKLILDLEDGSSTLYDLALDISEQADLSQAQPGRAAEMAALLEAKLVQAQAQMPTKNPDYEPGTKRSRR